jgi:hypothetical protein
MTNWREEQHPRDPKGRFREKGGGWAGTVADQMSRGLWSGRVRAPRRHIDVTDMGPQTQQGLRDRFAPEDPMLAEIYRRQGFDGPPQVVSEPEMDDLVARGEVIEVWRGIERHQHPDGSWSSARELAEQYRTGPYFAGQGVRGNGTYTTTDKNRATVGYSEAGGLLRIGIAADARIADVRDVQDMAAEYSNASEDFRRGWHQGDENIDTLLDRVTPEQIEAWILIDEGRLAAARGIDVIKIDRKGTGDVYIILNRTATVVQEAS